jgi:hypothetical protein
MHQRLIRPEDVVVGRENGMERIKRAGPASEVHVAPAERIWLTDSQAREGERGRHRAALVVLAGRVRDLWRYRSRISDDFVLSATSLEMLTVVITSVLVDALVTPAHGLPAGIYLTNYLATSRTSTVSTRELDSVGLRPRRTGHAHLSAAVPRVVPTPSGSRSDTNRYLCRFASSRRARSDYDWRFEANGRRKRIGSSHSPPGLYDPVGREITFGAATRIGSWGGFLTRRPGKMIC